MPLHPMWTLAGKDTDGKGDTCEREGTDRKVIELPEGQASDTNAM